MPVRSILSGTGGVNGTSAAGTLETFTIPAGTLPGDVFLVFTSVNSGTLTASITTPSGATTESGPTYAAGGVLGGYAFAKTLTAADITGGTVVVTWSSSAKNLGSGLILTGVDLSNVQVGTPAVGTTATALTAPTVTTASPSADVYVCAMVQNAQTTAPTLASFPAGYTSDQVAASAHAASPNYMVAVANLTAPGAAGPYGGGTVTVGNTPAHSIVYTIAIAATPFEAVLTPTPRYY